MSSRLTGKSPPRGIPHPLLCPGCGRPLMRKRTTVTRRGAVVERCDVCECALCGPFEVRRGRGKLKVSAY